MPQWCMEIVYRRLKTKLQLVAKRGSLHFVADAEQILAGDLAHCASHGKSEDETTHKTEHDPIQWASMNTLTSRRHSSLNLCPGIADLPPIQYKCWSTQSKEQPTRAWGHVLKHTHTYIHVSQIRIHCLARMQA